MGDFDFGSTAMGAGSGAAAGAAAGAIGGPMGAGIGAGAGALIGGIGGFFSGKAKNKQAQAAALARQQLDQLTKDTYAERMKNLNTATQFFKPVQDRLQRLYGETYTPNIPYFGAQQNATPPAAPRTMADVAAINRQKPQG